MTNSFPNTDRQTGDAIRIIVLSILPALLVATLAISNQSLWIDEGHSAAKAMQPSLSRWWAIMAQEKASDLQMPFYMFYLWVWAKLFGTSEIALRVANLPWFVAGILAFIWSFPQDRHLRFSIGILALTNAFLWYYLNEARPYIVLFAFSALMAGCLFRLREDPTSTKSAAWFRWFLFGIVGMCATNMIAVPWTIGALAALVFWVGPRAAFRTVARFPWSGAVAGTVLIALGLFYLWSLQSGARGSDVGRIGLTSLGFTIYELLGLAGLGSGRLVLRAEGVHALLAYAFPLVIGAIAIFTLCVASIAEWRKKVTRRDFIFFVITIAMPLALLVLIASVAHMRLLGRHFMPLLPFLLVFLAGGLRRLLFADRTWSRALAIIALAALFISALEIRFAPRHRRDDYRSAAILAQRALLDGKKVWWIADETTGAYYKLPLSSPDLTLSSTLVDISFTTNPGPDLVCYSKPDIYDPQGKIGKYLRDHDFKVTRLLPAFQIFERQPEPH